MALVTVRDDFRTLVDPGHTSYGSLLIEMAVAIVGIMDNQQAIMQSIQELTTVEDEEMADLTILEADVDTLITAVTTASADLADLSAKVANGTPAAQADIDAIAAKIEGATSTLSAAAEAADPATPPVPPVTEPAPPTS